MVLPSGGERSGTPAAPAGHARRRVDEAAERLVIEMDNRPDLANIRGAIQGGLVATLIDIAAGVSAGNASAAATT